MGKKIILMAICIAMMGMTDVLSAGDIDSVRARVYAWEKAWESRNIDTYLSFYSPAFRSNGLGYKEWEVKKARLFQKRETIFLEIYDVSVFIERDRAIVRFIQRYQDRHRTDLGEKTLIMVKSNNTWKIVSEIWKPLDALSREAESLMVFQDTEYFNYKVVPPTLPAPLPGKISNITVKNINFQITREMERVFIDFSGFAIPLIFTLEGEKPRIVIDIENVSSWSGQSKISVGGQFIQQIRIHLHRNSEKLRIVMDMWSSKNYMIGQIYDMTGNGYCLEVSEVF